MCKTSKGGDVKKECLNIKRDWTPLKAKLTKLIVHFGLVKNISKVLTPYYDNS